MSSNLVRLLFKLLHVLFVDFLAQLVVVYADLVQQSQLDLLHIRPHVLSYLVQDLIRQLLRILRVHAFPECPRDVVQVKHAVFLVILDAEDDGQVVVDGLLEVVDLHISEYLHEACEGPDTGHTEVGLFKFLLVQQDSREVEHNDEGFLGSLV